eukprot:TRINITY_DN66525_c0_g1_i1.p1 TRINITY_DN66525_c0_g1~~TRINITY_DN66525_c0_g1_i1.p1  ORF type:complete len:226 (+),score=83.45 TRINITY_DN66525_c0_g1_i1:75-752(+)
MADRLTQAQIQEFQDAFRKCDKDNSGTIDSAELDQVLDTIGMRLNEEEIAELMEEVDVDKSGQIDFREFLALMAGLVNTQDPPQDLIAAFKEFEGGFLPPKAEGEEPTPIPAGFVGVQVLQNVFDDIGSESFTKPGKHSVQRLLDEADPLQTGMIPVDTFVRHVTRRMATWQAELDQVGLFGDRTRSRRRSSVAGRRRSRSAHSDSGPRGADHAKARADSPAQQG